MLMDNLISSSEQRLSQMHNLTQNQITQKKLELFELFCVELSLSLMSKLESRLDSKLGVKLKIFWAFLSLNVHKNSVSELFSELFWAFPSFLSFFESSLITNFGSNTPKYKINTWPFWVKLEKAQNFQAFLSFTYNGNVSIQFSSFSSFTHKDSTRLKFTVLI